MHVAGGKPYKTALITGAAGFIGSHLAERCLNRGWRVIGIDGFTSYYSPAIKRMNVTALRANPHCTFIDDDLLSADLRQIVRSADIVFHLSAQPGVRTSWEAFDTYLTANVAATQRMLDAARTARLERFVFASSSSVYGNAEVFPIREDAPLRPISPYGVTKTSGEQLVWSYYHSHGVPAIILRYFTAMGPGSALTWPFTD